MDQTMNIHIYGLDPNKLKQINMIQSVSLTIDNWAKKITLDGTICIEESMIAYSLIYQRS